MSKKYWLKFHDNFFEDEKISFLMAQKNGHKYVVVWLKLLNLCIKKARVEGEESLGILRFSEKIPYSPDLLSSILKEDVDLITLSMRLFEQAGMIDVRDDETLFIEAIARLTGKESESAERVRKHREIKNQNTKLLQCNANVTLQNDNKEEEQDKEKEADKSGSKDPSSPLPFQEESKSQEGKEKPNQNQITAGPRLYEWFYERLKARGALPVDAKGKIILHKHGRASATAIEAQVGYEKAVKVYEWGFKSWFRVPDLSNWSQLKQDYDKAKSKKNVNPERYAY